jgi:hypothetical protein
MQLRVFGMIRLRGRSLAVRTFEVRRLEEFQGRIPT